MTTFSSFYDLLLEVLCLFSVSLYLWLSPPAEVISSHLLPKPLCFHPPPPLEKALSASGSKASPAPTTSCRGSSSCTVQDPVPGLWQLLSRSPTAEHCGTPPTHCFSEGDGDTGEPARQWPETHTCSWRGLFTVSVPRQSRIKSGVGSERNACHFLRLTAQNQIVYVKNAVL